MKKIPAKTTGKSTKNEDLYTYDTEIGVIEKKLKVKFDVPSDMKLGDFFKRSKEGEPFLRLLEP